MKVPAIQPVYPHHQAFKKIRSLTRGIPFLVSCPLNIFYLTGCKFSSAQLLIEPQKITLFVDGRYHEDAAHLPDLGVHLGSYDSFSSSIRALSTLMFEDHIVSFSVATRWKSQSKSTKFVQSNRLIEGLRRRKNSFEIAKISQAIHITTSVLNRASKLLSLGMTEFELARLIEQSFYDLGATGLAFETIVAFGENTSRPHHHPTHRALAHGDLVQIDAGASVDGYASDCSRVYIFGEMNSQQKKVYRALQKAKKAAEILLRPGVSQASLDRAARAVLRDCGLEEYFPHSLGHGLGLYIHEDPRISIKAPSCRLRKGDVLTIEPGVYIPGCFGMRIEDTYVIA